MTVLRITAIVPQGGADASDIVALDHDHRRRRRIVHTTHQGRSILLDRPNVVHLRDGDALVLEDGTSIRVEAVREDLVAISAPDVAALVRIAWHLGNRHLPTQLDGTRLLIRKDHVIEHMVEGLGGNCRAVQAAFDPEGGAYENTGDEGHAHGHAHGHGHGHHAHHHHDDYGHHRHG